ncbi:SMI1/KNR4 family protein [Clostridium beijerinckii]|uniref:SMI1/KNR4 family protein n=1 Tax=Clostridium beijerinckii TaxID=1520 RepID=UPI000809C1BA|nr:SMI1/KNR4 family protein [Clostridium beijerinckii]OCA98722.1 1,3-beta-glucan synthase regulator [Clostridium beijerinckii]
MIKKENEVIIKYFEILRKSHPEKFEIEEMFDEDGEPIVPENMKDRKDQNKWMLLESNVSEEDIHKLEEKFNVKLPSLYKAFISTYFHMFEELDRVIDDFHCEDGKEVYVDILPQPSNKPLKVIENVYKECEELIEFGYIPMGDFNGWGPLCFDTHNNYKLVWLDHEEYYSCETREEIEELGETIFDNFTEFLECFFAGVIHKC